MTVIITPSPISGKIKAIPSKSQAHRAFICAALSENPSEIICNGTSEDIEATIDCLRALGAEINGENGIFRINPINSLNKAEKADINCRESGSTLRFILPVLSALGTSAVINGYGRLPERPLQPLISQLTAHGAEIGEGFPLECKGRLEGGAFTIAGNISSQFISGLLLASPLTGEDCFISITTPLESKPYIDITIAVMSEYGIRITHTENGYFIKGNQTYTAPKSFEIEGDWSNAAFWLVCGGIAGNGITCTGLSQKSLQGDRAVVDILKRLGASVSSCGHNISVSPSPLKGIEIDASDIPDLVPVLAVAACGAAGRTKIFNASRLRHKESDRLQAVEEVLRQLGADIEQSPDGLIINGTGRLKGGRASASGDHRIAMSLAVAASICDGDVIIDNAEAAAKSYPAFFEHYRALGGRAIV